jgi:hypothetical protein
MFGKLFKRNVPGAFGAEMLDAFDRKFRDFYGTNILLRSGFLSYLTSTFSDSDRPKEGTVGYCYIQWPWYGAAIKNVLFNRRRLAFASRPRSYRRGNRRWHR